MSLKQFSEDFGREISQGLLSDINARAGLPADANGAESTTEASAPVRLFYFLNQMTVDEKKKFYSPSVFFFSVLREAIFPLRARACKRYSFMEKYSHLLLQRNM